MHERLPDYYLNGVDIDGTQYSTTPIVQSDASRDMYVRSLPGLMLAYDLLGEGQREDGLRAGDSKGDTLHPQSNEEGTDHQPAAEPRCP